MSIQSPLSVNGISDRYVRDMAEADPVLATFVGLPGQETKITDYSPDGERHRADISRKAVRDITTTEPVDQAEANAKAVFLERVGLDLEMYDAGETLRALNVIASPVQSIREVFDQMPTETADDWATIAQRMAAVPQALAGVRSALSYSAQQDRIAAIRQVTRVTEQCDIWSGRTAEKSFFAGLASQAEQSEIPQSVLDDLSANATAAARAYADFADFLREDLAPRAPRKDAVGQDRYQLFSRYFIGARIDLLEAYEWGWQEFARIEAEMKQIANEIVPGGGLVQAAAALDADPRYQLSGSARLREWMQNLSDQALRDLRGVHFEIPDPIMKLECRIAPAGGAASAYYVPPSMDFSRPGRMWWSLAEDKNEFPTWREVTTVYHEGVPGHHLQFATAVYQSAKLNEFQRLFSWVSGYGEGWALYAERLMRELGYLEDRGNLMGMLDAQLFRAARVVIDIGLHLELEIPRGIGFHDGERWSRELAVEFLNTRTIVDKTIMHDEVDRYAGWAGQAPAYKLGERLWLAARDDAKKRHGATFDLKVFHQQALEMGAMGLDTLRERLSQI